MNDAPEAPAILTRPILVSDIPDLGTELHFEPDVTTYEALAERYGLLAVNRLEANVLIKPWARTGFSVTGRVTGEIIQSCVVTLEPVTSLINEEIDVRLAPLSDAAKYKPRDEDDLSIDQDSRDPPDFYDGGTIDPGSLVEEHFVIGIDPYPRKIGVAFDPARFGLDSVLEETKPPSPFAALTKLKRD
jgi:hypothetical protein